MLGLDENARTQRATELLNSADAAFDSDDYAAWQQPFTKLVEAYEPSEYFAAYSDPLVVLFATQLILQTLYPEGAGPSGSGSTDPRFMSGLNHFSQGYLLARAALGNSEQRLNFSGLPENPFANVNSAAEAEGIRADNTDAFSEMALLGRISQSSTMLDAARGGGVPMVLLGFLSTQIPEVSFTSHEFFFCLSGFFIALGEATRGE